MRSIVFVAAALLLAGCETGEGWVPGDDRTTEQTPLAAPSKATAPPTPVVTAPVEAAPVPTAPMAAAPAPADPATDTPVPVNVIDAHCQAVARQRASDARANGYSFEMESTVYDGTYRACVAWNTHQAPAGAAP